MKAAFLHNVFDALASVRVIGAGIIIRLYDLYIADLIITIVIAAYVIYQGMTLMPQTVRLLMGAVPDDLEFDNIVETLRHAKGVENVHHVHLWSISDA